MYAFPQEPLGIGQQLDQGFKLAKYIYPSSFGVIALIAIVGVLSSLSGVGIDFENTEDLSQVPMSFWGGTLLFALINIYLYVLLVVQVAFKAYGKGDMLDAMSFSTKKLIPMIVMYILYILALMLGMILLVIPGLILMMSMSLCFYCMIIEDTGPIDSLRRSHSLVWGNWWRTATVLTVGGLIVSVFFILIGIIVGLMGTDTTGQPSMTANILLSILQPIIQPVLMCFGVVVFNDVRIRKEGGDLEDQISNL